METFFKGRDGKDSKIYRKTSIYFVWFTYKHLSVEEGTLV